MAERMIWMDRFGLGAQTNMYTAVNCSKGIALNNHPTFDPVQNIVDQEKSIGASYRRAGAGYEFQNTTQSGTTTWEFDVSADSVSHILWAFFQNGALEEAGSPYAKYFIPYEPRRTNDANSDYSDCEVWLTLVRAMAASGTSSSHRMVGAIPRSITLSAASGEPLRASVELIGYDTLTNHNIASDTLTVDAVAPLLWQDATVTLGGNAVNLDNFSITMTNNAALKHGSGVTNYNADSPKRFVFGRFNAEGTITIPWGTATEGANTPMNDFVSGNTDRLVIYWGTGGEISTTDLDFSILAHIRRTGAAIVGDDELGTEIPFVCVCDDWDSSVDPSSSIAIGADDTPVGTTTAFTNFDKGDILYLYGATAAGDQTHRVVETVTDATNITVFPGYSGTQASLNYRLCSSPLTITCADGSDLTIGT